jgi:hypothetical protein
MRLDGPIGQPANQTVARTYTGGIMSGFYNHTAGITTAEGAGTTLTFEGGYDAVVIWGGEGIADCRLRGICVRHVRA